MRLLDKMRSKELPLVTMRTGAPRWSQMLDFAQSPQFSSLLVFMVGVVLRGIPELLVSWYPVGYETIAYYAPPIFGFGKLDLPGVFVEFFRFGPLLYVVTWLAHAVSGAHPYLILKVVGPLLYGGLAASFLLFLRKGEGFGEKRALVGALLLVFQVAALRESWDRFRNVLGLIFVFAALTALKTDHKLKWWLVGLFGVLTALSREYIAFALFVSVLGFAFLEKRDRGPSIVALAPALTIFAIMTSIVFQSWQSWWNNIPNHQDAWQSYSWIVQDVLSMAAICFLPILPFVGKGVRRDTLLDPLVFWLLVGSFSVVVSPWAAIPGYQRWLMLLVLPFTVYALRGFDRLGLFRRNNLWKLVAILLVFATIAVGYASGAFSYAVLPNTWVPTSLVQSSIAWDDVEDVKGVLDWLDENAEPNSSILSEERFYGWTLIYLRRAGQDVKVVPYAANAPPAPTLERVLEDDVHAIYLIWYRDSRLDGFHTLHSRNDISIFKYGL